MHIRLLPILGLVLILASCGWMEVPYEGGGGIRVQKGGDDALFVGAGTVTVGKGDTVYAISRRHKVAMRAIIDTNGLKAPYTLLVGQKLLLPHAREHAVRRGDTLSAISERYRVSMFQTAQLNGIKAPYVIHVGQVLRLPSSRQVAAVTPLTPSPAPAPSVSPEPQPGQGFIWPVQGRVIDGFGPKDKGLQNDGINIAAPRGSTIKAADNGVVAYAGNGLKGFGNLILVRHADGWVTAYAHADTLLVKRGDTVKRGQAIARVGSTGTVTKPQLHFEMRNRGKAVDPSRHLPRASA